MRIMRIIILIFLMLKIRNAKLMLVDSETFVIGSSNYISYFYINYLFNL
ncbi:MAG: hypothetical protein BWY70_01084 [Bacteroidetes bacterium ADurb.Bin408]|nr:MAG: hypothetical protein BWY70_01084 [Bacteroidetes bacterium ADurb.Bin408]